MNDLLVPERELKGKDRLIWKLVEQRSQNFSVAADDPLYGAAFRYYLLFAEQSALGEMGLDGLSDAEIFHNEYYWFLLFSRLHQIKHGYDAGLEQQAFNLLESAPRDIDLTIVERINDRVEKEVARLSQGL
jgi:hypothetical protein